MIPPPLPKDRQRDIEADYAWQSGASDGPMPEPAGMLGSYIRLYAEALAQRNDIVRQYLEYIKDHPVTNIGVYAELVSRKLFPVRRVFCASPEYVRRHGTPRLPRDLMGHRIGWYSGYPTRERLIFHGANEQVSIEVKPVLMTNSVHLLREYALEHAGIVCVQAALPRASSAVSTGSVATTSYWSGR